MNRIRNQRYVDESAGRLAFLIDAAAYFDALAAAIENARRSIFLIGWDFHSQTRLRRGPDCGDSRLVALLDGAVRRRPDLQIRVLSWDFATVFALEREPLPVLRLSWGTHARVRFDLDGKHPLGACHHEKIAVVDDALAFVGGIDLTLRRWDTPEHRAPDPRRIDPDGQPYPPFHDLQAAVSGPAARRLGEIARERWTRATGEEADPAAASERDPWPQGLEPDLEDVEVGIVRTRAEFEDALALDGIETWYRDAIASAVDRIYIENQYLTSRGLTAALAERLRETDGPEVRIVLPERTRGWLEHKAMGVLRARRLGELREADVHGRLQVFYPVRRNSDDDGWVSVQVHAKLCIVDDERLTLGSANLSDRSMGLDTECNLVLESRGREDVRAAIRSLRQRLLAEHTGEDGDESRRLEPLSGEVPEWLDAAMPSGHWLDPERPLKGRELLEAWLGKEPARVHRGVAMTWITLAVFTIGATAWPLDFLASIAWPTDTPTVVALFVAGLALRVPWPALLLVCALAPGGGRGALQAASATLIAACLTYGAGRLAGRRRTGRWFGRAAQTLAARLRPRTAGGAARARIGTDVPFAIFGWVAGASSFGLGRYLAGTCLALVPAGMALWVVARLVAGLSESGGALRLAGTVALSAACGLAHYLAARRLRASQPLGRSPDGPL